MWIGTLEETRHVISDGSLNRRKSISWRVWEVTCVSTWIGTIRFPGLFWFSRSTRHQVNFFFAFFFVLISTIRSMLTSVLCVFFHVTPSLILSSCSIQTADLVQFPAPDVRYFSSEFFHTCFHFRLVHPGPARLHTMRDYVSQPSFNWLISCWVAHISFVCRPRVWPTGDVAP